MRSWLTALDRVLRGEATKPVALAGGTVDVPAGGLSALLVVLGAAYGACMGTFSLVSRWTSEPSLGLRQMAYGAAKVPMLFGLTLMVTLPSLYVFNALVGARLSFAGLVRLLVASLAVTIAVLASFGTITIFFSLCTTSYPFMVLLNVLLFAVAGMLGMNFLLQTLHRLALTDAAPVVTPPPLPSAVEPSAVPSSPLARPLGPLDRPAGQAVAANVKTVFRVWVLVFALVGAQMAWILRPFIGAPGTAVTFFRAREGNFFQAVAEKMADLATGQSWHRPASRP